MHSTLLLYGSYSNYRPSVLPDVHDVVRKILDMLQRSTIVNREISDPRQRFWMIYRTAAEEFDNEFLKKYDGDMNTSMIFVSPSLPSASPA